MEERNTHIDQWLQQAAARQEQETASPREKQAGWAALQGMLPPAPRRLHRWFWLGGAVLLGVMGYVLFEMRPWVEKPLEINSTVKGAAESMKAAEKGMRGESEPGTDDVENKDAGAKGKAAPYENKTAEDNNGKSTKEKDSRHENAPEANNYKGQSAGAKTDRQTKNKTAGNNSVASEHTQHKSTADIHMPGAEGNRGIKDARSFPDALFRPLLPSATPSATRKPPSPAAFPRQCGCGRQQLPASTSRPQASA